MRLTVLQILAGLGIAAAGLVPIAHKNKPFWGLYGISFDQGPPRLHQVDPDSPAWEAGLQKDDKILSIDGIPVDNQKMSDILQGLNPGETVKIRIQRDQTERELIASGVQPPIALIYYPTIWHPVAGGLGLTMALLVFATQPLQPAPLWRASLVAAAGLVCGTIFFLAILNDSPFLHWRIRQYHILNWGDRLHFQQTWVGLIGSLVLSFLGAWDLRGLLTRGSRVEVQRNQ